MEENIYYVEIQEVSERGIMRQYGLLQILWGHNNQNNFKPEFITDRSVTEIWNKLIYIYTHIHMCIYTYMYTCVYIYTYTCVHTYIHMCVYTYRYICNIYI